MFDELRRTLQYVEASRASAPFSNAQGNRNMRLFSSLLWLFELALKLAALEQ